MNYTLLQMNSFEQVCVLFRIQSMTFDNIKMQDTDQNEYDV